MPNIRKTNIIPVLLSVIWFLHAMMINAQIGQKNRLETNSPNLYQKAKNIRYQNPDKAITLLDSAYEQSLIKGDTLQAINVLVELADVYGNNANYTKSYDVLWKGLALTDNLKKVPAAKAILYSRLGRYYSFYKKKEVALEYLVKALEIKKEMVSEGDLEKGDLVRNYYEICATYRELDQPNMAKAYLDSCLTNYSRTQDSIPMVQLDFEKAFVELSQKKYDKALHTMDTIEPWFQENRPSYLVLVYTYWGDIYVQQGNSKKGETYYKKALAASEEYHSHLDFTPLIFERLAKLYLDRGDYKSAYTNMATAKKLDARYFDSRSPNNQSLLEVKDSYRQEKERQEKLIQKQRVQQLEQKQKISLLQRIILLGTIVFFLIFGWLYIKHLRSKHKAEKKMIRRNKEMEIQKGKELLELKNKELAASALQLVEKDEFLRELKAKLRGDKGQLNIKELNRVIRNVSANNSNNWEEFKLRFTQINEKFYKKLTTSYPKLTQSDQKVCALIKLNFSSKEMARLFGISVESVHTTRYRLRKKLGLERNMNLEDFIAKL